MLRIALNPTRDLHINDLRVALFNYIVSKQLNEELLIRIEDLEKDKNIEGKDKEILELLSFFSIDYRGVVYESENLKYHQKMAMQLLTQKKAFACFCSDEKLNEIKEKAKSEGKNYEYDGFCETLSDETVLNCNAPFTVRIKKSDKVDSFIILKHDKTPTFNYASAVDDMLYDTTVVINYEKDSLDEAKQNHVRNQLNYNKEIDYIHISNIIENENNNLNNVKWLIDEGFLPSAIANYLVLLGNETPKEIFTLEEAISWFDIKNISKTNLEFDLEKLKEINKKHLEEIEEMRLSKILGFADSDIGKLGKLYLEEVTTIKEIKAKIDAIFTQKDETKDFKNEVQEIITCLKEAPFINNFDKLKEYILDNTNLNANSLDKPLRYALTGSLKGPDLSKIYSLIKNYTKEIAK